MIRKPFLNRSSALSVGRRAVPLASLALLAACATTAAPGADAGTQTPQALASGGEYDVVIRGGTIYDGTGGAPVQGDVAIEGDRIVKIGAVDGKGDTEVDATGMAVSPGFVNMLSWATRSLLTDGRAMSDLKQGVTLEVFGEGWTMGPLSPEMKAAAAPADGSYQVDWTTLGEYLEHLEEKGISPNVASFVGATTLRIHEMGEKDVDPTPQQLDNMRGLVRQAMQEGALGVGSALIYAPANYAETPEITALVGEAAKCGGMYISHMRSEGDEILAAVDELIGISKATGAPAEIYHLKMAGTKNWDKLPAVIEKVEAARAGGNRITTNMYTYTAGGTGLDAVMPPWAQDGGIDALVERLKDPELRARIAKEISEPSDDWENLLLLAGGAEGVLLVDFESEALKPLAGKTLAEVAAMRGKSPEETAIDLVIEGGNGVGAAYFMMSEDNVRSQTALPWMSFGSDAGAPAAEGEALESSTHPRTYGNFARLLGKYVRDEQALPLEEAIHKLAALPAENLGLRGRGTLAPGNFADVVIFDPATISDHATFQDSHRYATGVRDVFVNGTQVLKNGEHTGASPGTVVRGPGWTGWPDGGKCPADTAAAG